MSVSCEPNDMLAAAKCVSCIPAGLQDSVIIYLLNEILGTGLTVEQLIENAKCFQCIPKGMQDEVKLYLLCAIADASGA